MEFDKKRWQQDIRGQPLIIFGRATLIYQDKNSDSLLTSNNFHGAYHMKKIISDLSSTPPGSLAVKPFMDRHFYFPRVLIVMGVLQIN